MLRAAVHLEIREPSALELVGEGLDALGEVALAYLAALRHHARDALVGFGLQIEERKILELPFDGAHAQAVGERRIHIHGLARFEQASIFAQRREGAHVVQAVGKLDDDHADVLRHGEKHLAQVQRLLLVDAIDLDVRELRDTVHQHGDRLAEKLGHIGERDLGVLDGIVKKRRAHHVAIHVELCQDDGDLDRMVDVGFAGAAALGGVLLRCEAVRVLDRSAVIRTHVLRAQLREVIVVVRTDLGRQIVRARIVHHLRRRHERRVMCGARCSIHGIP